MRWLFMGLLCAVVTTTLGDPDPKKYKPDSKEKQSSTNLTDEEKTFLRDVEAKFGVKSDVPIEKKEEKLVQDEDKPSLKPPFPAVIAIEIVNDTSTDEKQGKGKRTIDANLGYGYQTNNGYTYSYFGKPAQEKGKFMIYPYSQEDIPPPRPSSGKHSSAIVDIQQSQAYELIPVKNEEPSSYHYNKPATEFRTGYENIQGLRSPSHYQESHSSQTPSSILYTTYNGEKLSGLQGQFPKVMPNYFVNPSQLLQHPQYQSVGLTQDHLHTHGSRLEQRVVPVLVLRIPSSYLKNPSAELYANLPRNYPLSNHLNNVNLQELVNQYFKNIGYNSAPQIMTYPNAVPVVQTHVSASPVSMYEPQQYARPYVRPSYTHADYSGVQYSAVQPVMARYPTIHSHGKQYYTSHSQPLYRQPLQKQNYEYRYHYNTQPTVSQQQQYYVQQQYQSPQQVNSYVESHQEPTNTIIESSHNTASQTEYSVSHEASNEDAGASALTYEADNVQNTQQYDTNQGSENEDDSPKVSYEYETQTVDNTEYNTGEEVSAQHVGSTMVPDTAYGPPQPVATQYSSELTNTHSYYNQEKSEKPVLKETKTITIYPQSYSGQTTKYLINTGTGEAQAYVYQNQENEQDKNLVLSENYPSKDHTQAAVLPLGYKNANEAKQSVSYVTPMPYKSAKYHSQYNVMVPQTVFKPSEQVSYVNSQSQPMHYLNSGVNSASSSEDEYTTSRHYIPPVGSQRPISYPKNYHAYKRMANKSDTKPELSLASSSSSKVSRKEQTEKTEQKKSS